MLKPIAAVLLLGTASPALADALIDNVNGVTLDKAGRVIRFTGLLMTTDGKVTALLAREDKRPARADWRVDMKGRVMLPGMIDAHGHVMGLGFQALTLDLSDTTSLAQAQAKIRAYAAANPERRWIIGRGWNQERWQLGAFRPRPNSTRRSPTGRSGWSAPMGMRPGRTARRCARRA
jgi:predicted amidohydrolase YtcJ